MCTRSACGSACKKPTTTWTPTNCTGELSQLIAGFDAHTIEADLRILNGGYYVTLTCFANRPRPHELGIIDPLTSEVVRLFPGSYGLRSTGCRMADELPWAMTSVRVFAAGLSGEEIALRLGMVATQAADDRWIRDVRAGDDEPLDGQFEELTTVLAELETRVEKLPADWAVDVLISWSPRGGQDHAGFGPELLGSLGRLGAVLRIDTWTE